MEDTITIESFQYKIKKVMEGGMGEVMILDRITHPEGIDRIHQLRLAAKIIKTSIFSEKSCEQFERELNIWITLDHPNILQLLKIVRMNGSFMALMPYCEDSLKGAIIKCGKFKKKDALQIIYQIVQGLSFAFYNYNIVHLDIKPENILIRNFYSNTLRYLISDWGISSVQNAYFNKFNAENFMESCAETYNNFGTLPYMSPERLIGSVPSNIASDIYAIGMILYEMCFGHLPFIVKESYPLQNQIVDGNYIDVSMHHLAQNRDKKLAMLIFNCIHPDIQSRFSNYRQLNNELNKQINSIKSFFRF